jgi:hypothetical protein
VVALKKTRFSNDGKLLTFGVESPLLKEEITARLKRKGVFPDASFSKELVKLPVDAFVEFLDEIVDDETTLISSPVTWLPTIAVFRAVTVSRPVNMIGTSCCWTVVAMTGTGWTAAAAGAA